MNHVPCRRRQIRPRILLWFGLTTGLAGLIAVLTLTSVLPAPPVPGGSDKVSHALAFGVLVLPAAVLVPQHLWSVALGALIYGGLIELVQPLAGREREFLDLIANGAGIMVILLLGCGLRFLGRRTG